MVDIHHWSQKKIELLISLNKSHGKLWDNGPLLHNQKGRNNIASNLPENTKMLLQLNGLNSANLLFAKDNFHVGFYR